MSISEELNKIKNAIYGREVRDAIHDGIKKTYDDATQGGNTNMEVSLARGGFQTLNERLTNVDGILNSVNTQLAQKANEKDVRVKAEPITLNDFDGETLGIIQDGPGGTPVNVYSIPRVGSVTPETTNFLRGSRNLFDMHQALPDTFLDYHNGGFNTLVGYSSGEEYIPVRAGQSVTLQYVRVYVFYDLDFNVYKGGNTGSNSFVGTVTPEQDGFIRITSSTTRLDRAMVEYGDVASPYEPFGMQFYRVNFSTSQRNEIESIALKVGETTPGNKDIKVIKSGNQITLSSDFGDGTPINIDITTNNSSNGSFRLNETEIHNKRVHWTGDDITPIRTNIATVGANHGYTNIVVIEMSNHGKSTSDLGSRWTDGSTEYTLLKISGDLLTFGCPYTISNGIVESSRVAPTDVLTHVSGATNTGDVLTPTILSGQQLYPSINKLKLKFEVDGKEIAEDGTYYGKEFKIYESYNVMDYKSIIDFAQSNIGTSFANDDIEGVVRLSNTFTYRKGLNCTTSHSLKTLKKVELRRCGFLQSGPMVLEGHTLKRWMPNVRVKSGIDFASGVDMADYSTSLLYDSIDYVEPDIPPNHTVDWLLDSSGNRKYGFSIGYIVDKTNSKNSDRVNNLNVSWDMRASKKIYPVAVEGTFDAGTYLNFSGFRNYLYPEQMGDATMITRVPDNKDEYLYVDYNSTVVADSIPIDGIGKLIDVVQTENINVLNDVVDTEGVIVSSVNNGSAILKVV